MQWWPPGTQLTELPAPPHWWDLWRRTWENLKHIHYSRPTTCREQAKVIPGHRWWHAPPYQMHAKQRKELSPDFRNTKVRHRLWPLELAHLRGSLRSRMSTTPHTASACWARQGGCTHPTPAGSPWTSLPPHTGPQDETAQRGTLKRKCKDIKIYRSPHKNIFRK